MAEVIRELPPTFMERFESLWILFRGEDSGVSDQLTVGIMRTDDSTMQQVIYRTGYGVCGREIECLVGEDSLLVCDTDLYNKMMLNNDLDGAEDSEWLALNAEAEYDPVDDLIWLEKHIGHTVV